MTLKGSPRALAIALLLTLVTLTLHHAAQSGAAQSNFRLFLPTFSQAQLTAIQPVELRLASHLGGPPGGIAFDGHTAILTLGRVLHRLDLTDPTRPTLLPGSPRLIQTRAMLKVVDHTAFLVEGDAELHQIDVSTPGAFTSEAVYHAPSQITNLAATDHYLYLGLGAQGLLILEWSAGHAPHPVAAVAGEITALAVDGSHAYLIRDNALVVVDVSVPATPRVVGALTLPNEAKAIVVSGSRVYVASSNWLMAVDVSDPAAPQSLGRYTDWRAYFSSLALDGGYVYLYNSNRQLLYALDVSDPTAIQPVGSTFAAFFPVALRNGYAYLPSGETGLRIVDITDPGAMRDVGRYDSINPGRALAATGDYVFLAAPDFDVVDLSDPRLPQVVKSLPAAPNAIVIQDTVAYSAEARGLRLVDITNPAAPVELGFYPTATALVAVRVRGSYAYVLEEGQRLRVLSIANPARPVAVGAYDTQGLPTSLALNDHYAYIGTYSTLRVVDIADPAQPREALVLPELVFGLTLTGEKLVMSGQTPERVSPYALSVYDVAVPDTPTLLGRLGLNDAVSDLVAQGRFVYLATRAGLQVVDLLHPSAPRQVLTLDLGPAHAVRAEGERLYVVGRNGLFVFDVQTMPMRRMRSSLRMTTCNARPTCCPTT